MHTHGKGKPKMMVTSICSFIMSSIYSFRNKFSLKPCTLLIYPFTALSGQLPLAKKKYKMVFL